jgi:hypothetical protein
MAKPHDPKNGVVVTMLSDNLMDPKVWVGQIKKYPSGLVEYAVQFYGQDEGKAPVWREADTERKAKAAIKATVRLHLATKKSKGK